MKANRLSEIERLQSVCRVSTGLGEDRFVGISASENGLSVVFPLGYRIPSCPRALRCDIRALLNSIRRFGPDSRELGHLAQIGETCSAKVPVADYFVLIDDYLQTGRLLAEDHTQIRRGHHGSIDWSRTIASIEPLISKSNNVVYPAFAVRRRNILLDSTLELIHAFCLFEAYSAIGWLFPNLNLQPPRLQAVSARHERLVISALRNTFNDRDRLLLASILNVIRVQGSFDVRTPWKVGTDRYEYVWESMIDEAVGIDDRERFFPGAHWNLADDSRAETAKLQPDTLMSMGSSNGLSILDAKYYRYCSTRRHADLPGTGSISKQIIYGDYAAEILQRMGIGPFPEIWNAFLLPGDVSEFSSGDKPFHYLGSAQADWGDRSKNWHQVHAIVADTRFLLRNYRSFPPVAKARLAQTIREQW